MIIKFKIFENDSFSAVSPKGMDVDLYVFVKEHLENSNYEIMYCYGNNTDENLDGIMFGIGDEIDLVDDTFVYINDLRAHPNADNGLLEFNAYNFSCDSLVTECESVRDFYMGLYDFIMPIIDKYKTTSKYKKWLMSKEIDKYNL
jgi:hypothetical protein